MLYLTGVLNGKTYDETIIPVKELMTIFKIPAPSKYVEFRMADNLILKKPNGEIRHPKGFSLDPSFKIVHEDGEVTIRYSSGRTKKGDGYEYDTKKVEDFNNLQMVFINGKKLEKFVWFMLHPSNQVSPFKAPKQPLFTFYDREAIAASALALNSIQNEVIKEVLNMDVESLRVMAKGLRFKVNGQDVMVPRATEAGEAELRNSILQLAMTYGTAFVDAWRSGGNTLVGMLQHVVDAGKITLQTSNGARFWAWTIEEGQKDPITQVRTGETDMEALKLSFETNYSALYPVLQSVINNMRTSAMGITQPVALDTSDEVTLGYVRSLPLERTLETALLKDLIVLDRATGNLNWLKDGEPDGDVIYTVEDKKNWQVEFVTEMKKDTRKNIREGLAMRVYNHLKPVPAEVPGKDKK